MATSNSEWVQYKADILARLDFAKVFAVITDQRPSGEGCVQGRCPFHDDHDPSFGVDLTTGAWQCFTGCGSGGAIEFHMRRTNQKFKEALLDLGDSLGLERPTCSTRDSGDVVYPYQDEHGTLLYEVVRKPGKRWTQRRPDGKGGWAWNLKGVERVLYNLPDLNARRGEKVYVVEGEKDADRLKSLGLLATTNSGGAGKWRPSYSEVLKGRTVVILPDNDAPGRHHAQQVAHALVGVAASVKVVALPDLQEKSDVSDWLGQGHSVEELTVLVDGAPRWAAGGVTPGTRPVVQVNDRQLLDTVNESWRLLLAPNDPPRLFSHGGKLARLVTDDAVPSIVDLSQAAAFGELIRAADWIKVLDNGTIFSAKPPKEIADDLLVNVHPDLPPLDAVATTPVFDAKWRLLNDPGYHRDARLWLHLPGDQQTFAIPDRPTAADLEAARTLLLADLLVDFPFTADSDLAHAVAALLLPFARRMFDGPTPVHLIEAPVPGSGKSLLADLISIVCMGETAGSTTLTRDENETRKKLTALLCRGRPIISIDNLDGGLWSSQLASAITADRWDDRILGKTEMVTPLNRALWLASGNNPGLSLEIARRCIRIRLSPAEEQPWKRVAFKHPSVREWAHQNRAALVRAALTIIRSWIWAGGPDGQQVLGSFEPWSRMIGGMIEHLGLPGFLGDADEFYAAADTETGEWSALVNAWSAKYGETPVGVRELLELADTNDLVAFACAGQSEQARRAKFGKALSGLRGRRFGDVEMVIVKDSHSKASRYRLRATAKQLFPIGDESK